MALSTDGAIALGPGPIRTRDGGSTAAGIEDIIDPFLIKELR
jgi:hypothetical protein